MDRTVRRIDHTLRQRNPDEGSACDLGSGGAKGPIIGRNTFQRPREQALDMLDAIIGTYQNKMWREGGVSARIGQHFS